MFQGQQHFHGIYGGSRSFIGYCGKRWGGDLIPGEQDTAGVGWAGPSIHVRKARHLASWRPWVVLVWAIGWPFVSPSVGIGKGLSPREPRDVYSLEHTFAERTQLLGNLNGFRVGIYNSAIMYCYFDVWFKKKFMRRGKDEFEKKSLEEGSDSEVPARQPQKKV